MEGRSTVDDRRQRNSYHRVCYVFVEQAASECHWNWTAMGDDQCPTEGDSRLRGTREPVRQATDVRACTTDVEQLTFLRVLSTKMEGENQLA